MIKRGFELLVLCVAFVILVVVVITSVQPYLPYIGFAVIVAAIGAGARLYYSRRKFW